MIPIQLSLQGLYSYQEKQTIDFTKLTEAHLFGIFGSVGSGKSTILEAITFALYGHTDRLNQKGDNRNYNMMNLKSNDLFIEFIFRTGKDDCEYMATVKGRRNSKQFEEVKALDRSAYQKVNGQFIPIEVENLPEIIGLSYENFKRTVIIPQGRFQEFLQLGNSDRTKMMKELFNLEKFELFYQVVSLENKNNKTLQTLEGQTIQLGEIRPEQITALQESMEQLKQEIEKQTKDLNRHKTLEEQFRKQKELSEKIVETLQMLENLKSEEVHFLTLEKNIQQYEYCQLNFKNLLDSVKSSTQRIAAHEKNGQSSRVLLEETNLELQKLEPLFVGLKTAFEGRESYRQQAEELDKINQIHQLQTGSQLIQQRLAKGETTLRETEDQLNKLDISQKKWIDSIRVLKEQLPDLSLLSNVRTWYTQNHSLLAIQKALNEDAIVLDKELQTLTGKQRQCWQTAYPEEAIPENPELALDGKLQELKRNLEELNREMEHLSVQTRLEDYASKLTEGQECPLCGALSHPNPLNILNLTAALEQIRKQKKKIEGDITSLENLQKELLLLSTNQKLKWELQTALLGKLKLQENELANHRLSFVWPTYGEEKALAEAFEKAQSVQEQLKMVEAELECANKAIETERNNKIRFNEALDKFRHELTENASKSSLLAKQLVVLHPIDFENKTPEELLQLQSVYLAKYQEIGATYTKANDQLSRLNNEKSRLTGILETNQKILEQEYLQNKEMEAKLNDQLILSEYQTLEEVESVLSLAINSQMEKSKLKAYRETVQVQANQLKSLQTELGTQKYDPEQHQQVKDILQQEDEKLKLNTLQQGKLAGELENLQKAYESLKTLIDQIKKVKDRAEDLKILKGLFKASGFVNYISSVYLQELCQSANNRFYKLTRQKLSLEVTEENNFQVRDFMNGGKTRNVKTLSGGQTFQAALSLALALADNIQKITESNQNFFFLDEGFGSLDKESLDVVFETLKSLRRENRIVGVISHVEEMQQEIDSHLKIENHEDRGSLIKPSWS